MKKILVIITTDFVSIGGLTTVMMNYYRAIDKSDLQIDFASTNVIDSELSTELQNNGSNYYCLGNRKKNLLIYCLTLRQVLISGRYDIIHINANSATAAIELSIAFNAGVKRRIVHNHTSKCNHRVANYILRPLYKGLYTDAVACSAKAGEWLYGKNNFLILNNSIYASKYVFTKESRGEIRKKYRIAEDVIVIGHLGKIYEPKNHRRIIEIFNCYLQKNKSTILMLVGDGELRKNIEQYVTELGISKYVIFTGMQTETYKYLSAFDVFLFPSLWEGMPLSLIEAQASGLNCIASSSIDHDVAVGKSVRFLNLSRGNEEWCKAIAESVTYDRVASCELNIKLIKEKNYDVVGNASKLRCLYLENE